MISFNEEFLEVCLNDVLELIEGHWAEVGDKHLEPDLDGYLSANKIKALRVFTARNEEDGRLVGYAFFWIARNMHSKREIEAMQELLFIHPASRGIGRQFVEWCDENLKMFGVTIVKQSVTLRHDFGPMLEKLGYEFTDKLYTKQL